MRNLGIIVGAAAFVAAVGFSGTAEAEITYSFDGDLVGYWPSDVEDDDPTLEGSGSAAAIDGILGDADDPDTTNDPSYDCSDFPTVFGNVCSLDYDNDGDYVQIPNDATLRPASTITVAAWVRNSAALPAANQYILTKNNVAGKASYALWSPIAGGGSSFM